MFEEKEGYSSRCILQHDLGGDLIMNSEPHPKDSSIIAAGIGSSAHLLKIERQSKDISMESPPPTVSSYLMFAIASSSHVMVQSRSYNFVILQADLILSQQHS